VSTAAVLYLSALVVGCWIAGFFMGWFCTGNENADPTINDTAACDLLLPAYGSGWWLAVLWPAVLYGATLLSKNLRRFDVAIGAAVVVLAVVFWVAVALDVPWP
jgi:hypothetical protein